MQTSIPPVGIRGTIRRMASDMAQGNGIDLAGFGAGEILAVIEEFGTYQLELEAQNEEIRASQQEAETARRRFEILYERSPAGYLTLDQRGLTVEANATACDMLGIAKAALLGSPFVAHLARDSADSFHLGVQAVLHGGRRDLRIIQFAKDPGRWFQAECTLLELPGGEEQVLCMVTDRTERVEALNALVDSEAHLRLALDAADAGTWQWDLASGRNVWSEETWRLYGLEPGGRAPSFDLWLESIHSEDRQAAAEHVRGAVERGAPLDLEWRVDAPNGPARWVLSRGRPSLDASSRVTGYLGIVMDTTGRKRMEIALRASLREKDVLLKEVHHRVKNNLQILDSLIALQADCFTNPELGQAFQVMRNRIRSIALVHERLYRSRDLGAVDMKGYVTDLVRQIVRSHDPDQGGEALLRFELGDVSLGVDQAIPLGLLLTELVINACKHALRPGSPRALRVELDCPGEACRLLVSDEGPGLPEGFDLESGQTMGMQLVRALVGQLHGRLRVLPGPGACFEVVFPQEGQEA